LRTGTGFPQLRGTGGHLGIPAEKLPVPRLKNIQKNSVRGIEFSSKETVKTAKPIGGHMLRHVFDKEISHNEITIM
jgi:hypothetical protein